MGKGDYHPVGQFINIPSSLKQPVANWTLFAFDRMANYMHMFIQHCCAFLFYSIVHGFLWFGDSAEGGTVSSVNGHGPTRDTSQGDVFKFALPTTNANLSYDALSQ